MSHSFGSTVTNHAVTVGDVIAWYEANEVRDFSPVALKERRRLWMLFRKHCGSLVVDEVRPLQLLEWLSGQAGARTNHTRRRFKATICRPFNVAASAGFIVRNPFAGLRIPDGKNGRDWTDAEYQTVLRSASAYFRRFIVFLRFSGGRPGEARTLEWSHIHSELEAIVQHSHKTEHTSREPRRIHFNGVLVKLLAWLHRHRTHPTFVFTNCMNRPWTIRALSNHLALIRERVGLPRDVRCHGARHTFATHAIMNGVDLATLAQLLGHASTKTTERYLHLIDKRDHLNAAMERAVKGK